MNKDLGIYIHIPFCTSKCHYCNFTSFENKEDYIEQYIDALCNEILQKAEILSEYNIKSIYFGGGTPSCIDSKYIIKILDTLKLFENSGEDNFKKEITIEINPGEISKEKINDYVKNGINRVSIGLQTTHDEILKKIGRKHTFNDFKKTLIMCKNANITNISIDLIYPLPEQNVEMFSDSLDKIINLSKEYNIKHISIYNLEVHSKTKLAFLLKENYLTLPDEEQEYQMKKKLESTLYRNGFNKYEISNFSLPNFESKHNLNYWNQGIYLGFGVAAASFISSTRYKNIEDIELYIKHAELGTIHQIQKDEMDKLELMKEYIILNLRLKYGVNSTKFKSKFSVDIFDIFNEEISKLKKQKLIDITKVYEDDFSNKNVNIHLTNRGAEVANIVWENFI